MRLVQFVRHAQSTSNAGLPTEHPSSIPLTEKGVEQARLVGQVFQRQPEMIVTSAYLRTQITARPLMERYPQAQLAEWPVHEFTYMNPLNWQGTTGEQRMPAARAFWERNDPYYCDEGGAESFADLIGRIDRARELISQQADGIEIVLFSHGLFSRAFWWRVFMADQPVNAESMRRCAQFVRGIPFPNCSIVNFRFEEAQVWVSGPHTGHMPPELITY
jgi:broad specificity phosphatase PhoE